MIKFLKAAPVVFLIGTMVTAILYQKTLLEIWLTIAITFGTTAYHFIMRWVVAFIYNSIMHNRADYRKHWYQAPLYIGKSNDACNKPYFHGLLISN